MNSPDKADLQHRESDFAEIFNNFKNRMVEIEFSRRELKTIHENALKEAIKNADYIKTISAKSDGIYNSLHSMFFSHPDTGALAPYGFKEQTPDEKIENIKIQLNKQYCWLLAEAYEEFEDFFARSGSGLRFCIFENRESGQACVFVFLCLMRRSGSEKRVRLAFLYFCAS